MKTNNKFFEKVRGFLGQILNDASPSEKDNAIRLFPNIWAKRDEDNTIEAFVAWEITEGRDEQEIRRILEQASSQLGAGMLFYEDVITYYKNFDDKNQSAKINIFLNDVLTLQYKASKFRQEKQISIAKTFDQQAEKIIQDNNISSAQLAEYKNERQAILIKLFETADLLISVKDKAELEAEFLKLAEPYGFIDENGATNEEFNSEYQEYCVNRGSYTSKFSHKPNSDKSSADPVRPDSNDDTNMQTAQSAVPERLKIFPIRDAKGKIQAITPAKEYGEALYSVFNDKAHDISVSIDFDADKVKLSSENISIAQYGSAKEWEIEATESLIWNTGNEQAILSDTKIKAKKSAIKLGATNKVKIDTSGSVEIGENHDTEIKLNGTSEFVSNAVNYNLFINLGVQGSAILNGDLHGGTIQAPANATGKVTFSSKDLCAVGTRIIGLVPQTDALQMPDGYQLETRDFAADQLYRMELLFMSAFRLGQLPKYRTRKISWNPRYLLMSGNNQEFLNILVQAYIDGYQGQLIKNTEANTKGHAWKRFPKTNDYELLIFPIFDSAKDANQEYKNTADKGKFKYRCVLVEEGQHMILRNLTYYANASAPEKTGETYTAEYWKKLTAEKKHFFFDIECGALPESISLPSPDKSIESSIPDKTRAEVIEREWKTGSLFPSVYVLPCAITPEFARTFSYAFEDSQDGPFFNEISAAVHESSIPKCPIALGNTVFQQCVFEDINMPFYSEGMAGNQFKNVHSNSVIKGNMCDTSYLNSSEMEFAILGDVNFSRAKIDNSSLSINCKFDKADPLLKFFENEVQEDSLSIGFESSEIKDSKIKIQLSENDRFSAGSIEVKKGEIHITGGSEIDLSDAKLTECKLVIKGSGHVILSGSTLDKCSINVECNNVDAVSCTFDGGKANFSTSAKVDLADDSSDVNLSNSHFTGTKTIINGKVLDAKNTTFEKVTSLTGKTISADFTDATMGTQINVAADAFFFKLEAATHVLTGAKFGNIEIDDAVKINPEDTDWSKVVIVGNIKARLETVQLLYPLFGKAANLYEEVEPGKGAGRTAQPARIFAL